MITDSRDVVVYGNGSVARMLACHLRAEQRLAGIVVEDACLKNKEKTVAGIEVTPFSEMERRFSTAGCVVLPAIGYAEMNALRARIMLQVAEFGYELTSYIHPTSLLAWDGEVGEGTIILEHVSAHVGATIGRGVFISSNVNIGHDVVVSDLCFINSGVSVAGWSLLGCGSFFGINSSIVDGIEIGARNYIGANTLVARSTGDDEVWISPAGQKFRMGSLDFVQFIEDRSGS